jgi:integrase
MCTYLHKAPNGIYYFRMGIPAGLRPAFNGLREIKHSLHTKDREAAKHLIPDHTKDAQREIRKAVAAIAAAKAPKKAKAQLDWERDRYDFDMEQIELAQADIDLSEAEIEELGPVMDALDRGEEPDTSPVAIARAGKLLFAHQKQMAQIDKDRRASPGRNQAVEQGSVLAKGKGVYLDTDIIDGWAREKKPSTRGKDAYWRDAKLFNEMMGRKSVELITKADVMAFKRKLIDAGRSQINIRDRLAYLRTLLKWAAGEDLIPDNPAQDVRMAVTERGEEREEFSLDDLNAIFSGPVYSKGERPEKKMLGEATYWIPLIGLFMGARREEIGQLRVADVRLVPYLDDTEQRLEVWCIDITDTPDDTKLVNQIKNKGSKRLVPLHPALIQLGFVEYVQRLPDQAGRVFPNLKPVGIGEKLTDKWGQWFKRYRVACGVTASTKVFHSFRHGWKTLAEDAKMSERVQRAFQGHEGKDSADKYGKAAPAMRIMVEAIASFRVPGLKLPKAPHTDTP